MAATIDAAICSEIKRSVAQFPAEPLRYRCGTIPDASVLRVYLDNSQENIGNVGKNISFY
jgi:hypothetical protein